MKIKTVLLLLIFSGLAFSQTKIEIKNAWVRPAAKDANSALFFTIVNNGTKADTLFAAESKLADIVAIHETFKRDNDRMGMREVNFVPVPAKSKVEFKPGSFHVMLVDVQKDFRIGDPFNAVLKFKHAGNIKVNAVVQDVPAMGGMKH